MNKTGRSTAGFVHKKGLGPDLVEVGHQDLTVFRIIDLEGELPGGQEMSLEGLDVVDLGSRPGDRLVGEGDHERIEIPRHLQRTLSKAMGEVGVAGQDGSPRYLPVGDGPIADVAHLVPVGTLSERRGEHVIDAISV